MRELFQREESGELVSIEVDLNAFAYSSHNPWLLSLFIKFDSSEAQQEGYEEFLEIKESLIIALAHEERAKYVGSRVVDGWSELYFYAEDSKELSKTVSNIMKSTGYLYESSVVKDAKWDFHYKNLTPSALELANIESEKIIFMLQEEGDDISIVRDVEYYISFETPTQKERFLEALSLDGYSFKDEISSDEFENGIALVKKQDVRSETLKEEVGKLFEVIQEFQGYYEGWSTTLAVEIEEE